MKEILFYGHKSKGLIALLIRWKIGSAINHISIGLNGLYFESTALKNGVTVSTKMRDDITISQPLLITDKEREACSKYLEDSIGKEYDFLAFGSIAFNKNKQNDSKVFCNEFAAGIFDILGIDYKISDKLTSPKDFLYFVKGLNQGIKRVRELLER